MSTPSNKSETARQTNYLPWVLGGCAVALVLGVIVAGVAGFILYVMKSPSKQAAIEEI